MRAVVLALTLAFVAGQPHDFSLKFAAGKTYVYKYETQILGGLPVEGLARAGLNFTSKVLIIARGQNKYLLKLEEPNFYEYNGIWPQDKFIKATKLTEALAPQLMHPIKFHYDRGVVTEICAPEGVSVMVLNIYRGILGVLQLNIKHTQNVYELQEAGPQGMCKTLYAITEDKDERIILTKTRDMNDCQDRIISDMGLAYMEKCVKCQEEVKNLRGVTSYNYILKSAEGGVQIEEMKATELIQFSPFSEKKGAAQMETKQSLILGEVRETALEPINSEYVHHKPLKYEFPPELIQTPIEIVKTNNDKALIEETLNHLVTHNVETVHEDAPLKFLELVQLLRAKRHEELEVLWNKYRNIPVRRQWLLDSIIVTGTPVALGFIKDKILAEQLMPSEVAQALIGSIHMVTANTESLELFQALINYDKIKQQLFQREIILLGYGTMIYRHCSEMPACPAELITPILNHFAKDGLTKEEDVILYLKTLGNAGHPAGLKKIINYLPIHGTKAATLPIKVHVEAIMALRNIAKKEPRQVQELALRLYMDKSLHPELRMLSCIVMFETRPPMVLVVTLANIVKRETNMQVASFTYSHMKSLTRSTSIVHASVAAACNIAIKILGQKLDRLSFYYSRAIHLDFYNSPLMLGAAANAFYINDATSILPKSIMAKTRAYIAGAAADILEVGVRSEGLQEALLKNPTLLNNADRINKMKRVISAFSQWRFQPNSKPLASFYVKLFGQEIAFANVDKRLIDTAIEIARNVPIQELRKRAVRHLQEGVSFNIAKPLLATEVRRILPTVAGVPMELSLYTAAVTAAKVKVDTNINPALSDSPSLSDLWERDIKLEAEIRPSVVVNTFAVMGINIAEFQAGLLTRAKLNVTTPQVKIAASINLSNYHFKIEALPVSVPKIIAAVEVKTLAVTRMTEEAAVRSTPIVPDIRVQSHSKEMLTSRIASSAAVSVAKSSEIIPQEEQTAREKLQYRASQFKKKYCSKLVGVGLKACIKVATKNAGYLKDITLYKLAGCHSIALSLKPIEDEVIERLQMEVGVGQKAAEKLIKKITLRKEEDRERRPMLMRLKKILVPSVGNGTLSSSSSSSSSSSIPSSSKSSSASSSSSSRPSSKVNDAAAQHGKPRRSRRNSSSSSSGSSSSSSSSGATTSSSSSRISSSSSRSRDSHHRSSSSRSSNGSSNGSSSGISSSSSSRSSVRSVTKSSGSSSASNLASLFSGSSSSSSSHHSAQRNESLLFRKNHMKHHLNFRATSSARYRSSSSASSFENVYQQKKFLDSDAAVLAIVFRAVKANNRMQGYHVDTYLDRPTARLQVIVAPLAEDNNWRICADGILSSVHKAKARITWGAECSKYDTTVTAETGLVDSKPAARITLHSNRIPSTLKRYANIVSESITSYMASSYLGVDRNTTKKVALTMVETSDRTLNFIWRTQRRDLYQQTVHLPLTLPFNEIRNLEIFKGNNIDYFISNAAAVECRSAKDALRTFNNRTYSNKVPLSCYQILAADCTEDLKFIVLLTKDDREHNHINIKIADIDIDLYPRDSQVVVQINSRETPISSQSYQHPTEGVQVRQKGEGIQVEAPKYGLTEVYFDKSSWKIKVADWMKGQTCGLCGKADGEIQQEYHTPSGRLAKDEDSHALSWVVPGKSCKNPNECRLQHEFVQLEKQRNVHDQVSRCYSVEPVLRCLPGCFPVKTTQIKVGFHCLPAGSNPNGVNFYEKSETLSDNTEAHIACSCTAQCI